MTGTQFVTAVHDRIGFERMDEPTDPYALQLDHQAQSSLNSI